MRNTVGEKYDTTETKEFANPWLLMMFVAVILAEAEFLGITDLTGLNHVATGDHICGCEALLWFISAAVIIEFCGPVTTGVLHIATYFIFRSIIPDRQRLLLLHYAAVFFYYVIMWLCFHYNDFLIMIINPACLLYVWILPWIISVCFSFFFVSFLKKDSICSNINRVFAKIVRFAWFFTWISLPVAVFVKYML